MSQIYLDYNATTPLDPEVAEVIRPFLTSLFGNPSSIHEEGIKARKAVENSRSQLAALLHCHSDEIIFTSGGSEANNFAIKGIARGLRHKGNHIITTCIEHPAVTEVCRYLETEGFNITWLPVDENGIVDPGVLEKAITPATILVSVMHANNETGSIQPIAEIGRITREKGIIFHTDAAQSVGKIRVDVNEMQIDLLSVAGHKLYAPKGVGALYIHRGVKLEKLIHGADHEQNKRAGTENVMAVAGLGKAAEVAGLYLDRTTPVRELRDFLYQSILKELPGVKLNGHPEKRLPNTLNISFPGVEAALLLQAMPEIAASAGAACHSGSEVISPVLKAMGVKDEYAMGTVRFSLGRMSTRSEIESAAAIIISAYRKLCDHKRDEFISDERIKLTRYTHSLGCACKINPEWLTEILAHMPQVTNPAV
ncbi:MAG: IscS subfamily cysteine desulfurase, partial [Syntrophothermus sp.]